MVLQIMSGTGENFLKARFLEIHIAGNVATRTKTNQIALSTIGYNQ